MKTWTIRLFAFLSALSIGLSVVWFFLTQPIEVPQERFECNLGVPVESYHVNEAHELEEFDPEFTNVRIPEEFENGDLRSLVPVFKDGGGASIGRCELTPETKRPWLGLFKRGQKYSLEEVKVKFGRLHKDDFGEFIPMSFSDAKNALYLFGRDNRLKPGPVRTLYEMPYGGDNESLIGEGFRKEFNIAGRLYTLRVTSGTSETNNKVSIAVLESEGRRDFLYYRPHFAGNIGRFEWVGDLDYDQRLDVLFSFFAINGGGKNYILFLSSIAGSEHLVQPYAFFETRFRGC